EIDLNVLTDPSVPGALTIHLETDNAGSPSGTVVGADPAATVLPSTMSTYISNDTSLDVQAVFATPITLNPGTYWIVLAATTMTSGGNHIYVGMKGIATTGNVMYGTASSWLGHYNQYNMRFEVKPCN